MNIKRMMLLFTITVVAMATLFTGVAYGCSTFNTITQQNQWSNCTIDTNAANGINIFINTDVWNQPNYFEIFYYGLMFSVFMFLLIQDKSFARYPAIALFGLILALVMKVFGLVGMGVVYSAVALVLLSFIAAFFLHSNR